jgi:hypothetical protein
MIYLNNVLRQAHAERSEACRLQTGVGRPADLGASYSIWMPTRSRRVRLNSARYLIGGLSG